MVSFADPRFSRAARAALAAFLGLFAGSAHAAITVSVGPPLIETVARPRSTIRDIITFRNSGTEPLVVSVSFSDFGVDEAGEVTFEKPPGTLPSSVLPYIRVSPLRIRVQPGEQVFFRYTIKLPDHDFKQLRAVVFFAGEPDIERTGNQVVFVPRMGVPLYVESTEAKPAQLQIDEVKWARSPETNNTITLSMLVHNSGERNSRPTGTVVVRSADGAFEKTFPFNQGREGVLPGQKRNWKTSFGPVPEGDLSINFRMATSFRDTFASSYHVPAAH